MTSRTGVIETRDITSNQNPPTHTSNKFYPPQLAHKALQQSHKKPVPPTTRPKTKSQSIVRYRWLTIECSRMEDLWSSLRFRGQARKEYIILGTTRWGNRIRLEPIWKRRRSRIERVWELHLEVLGHTRNRSLPGKILLCVRGKLQSINKKYRKLIYSKTTRRQWLKPRKIIFHLKYTE